MNKRLANYIVCSGKLLINCSLLFLASHAAAQQRYQAPVFTSIDSSIDVQYGEAMNYKGKTEQLLLDVFKPANDTCVKRPMVIFVHGGGFQNNNKTGKFSSLVCQGLARRGYVTATIDYRLGVPKSKTNADYFEAMYRAVQDAKAAVRFFRCKAVEYGVDTNQIFIMGQSAGAKTAMHLAYLNQQEVPATVDVAALGSLEGNSGNPGYSSAVAGVVNCWGAMIDQQWIQAGDVPLFNVAGTADKTVPFDSSYDYHGFKYGAYILYERMLSLGISTGWRPFYGAGHTLDNSATKQDSAFQDVAQWLFTRLKINAPDKPEVLKWEADVQQLQKLDASEKYSANAVLFIGSSYIRMWTKMKQDLKPIECINRGFGGSKLSDVAYYIDRLAYPRACRAIVLYVGNDIVGNNLDKTPLQDLELVKYITKKLRERFPQTPIYWNQISPSEKRWAVWGTISEANALIKAWCEQTPNVHFIEMADKFLGKDGKPIAKYYKDDRLHYNDAGYAVWADILKKNLSEN